MRTECTRNCWMAGGIAGLLVLLSVALFGSAGWVGGIILGLLTAWMLGGTLVWGVCRGAGNDADNDALLAGGWRDEPFVPTRRVVGAGGEVVSEEPLASAGRIPGGAPLDSRTLTPADGAARAADASPAATPVRGAAPPLPAAASGAGEGRRTEDSGMRPANAAGPIAGNPQDASSRPGDAAEADELGQVLKGSHGAGADEGADATPAFSEDMTQVEPHMPESRAEAMTLVSTGFVEPRTDAEAGADPRAPEGRIEPLETGNTSGEDREGRKNGKDGDRSGKKNKKDKGKKDKEKKKAKKALAAGSATLPDDEARVMTLTGDEDAFDDEGGDHEDGDDDGDDLTRIRGVGPMLQTWLAGYGVTRFDQIAAWDDADIARFAGMMGRMGHRIRGEDWVGQARLLAAGGETAHSRAVDSGEAP